MGDIALPNDRSLSTLISTGDGNNQPVLCVTTSSSVHAVQWGTYDFLKETKIDMDDLINRSLMWAAQ